MRRNCYIRENREKRVTLQGHIFGEYTFWEWDESESEEKNQRGRRGNRGTQSWKQSQVSFLRGVVHWLSAEVRLGTSFRMAVATLSTPAITCLSQYHCSDCSHCT